MSSTPTMTTFCDQPGCHVLRPVQTITRLVPFRGKGIPDGAMLITGQLSCSHGKHFVSTTRQYTAWHGASTRHGKRARTRGAAMRGGEHERTRSGGDA